MFLLNKFKLSDETEETVSVSDLTAHCRTDMPATWMLCTRTSLYLALVWSLFLKEALLHKSARRSG